MTGNSATELLHMYERYADDVEVIEPGEDDLDSPDRIRRQLAEGVKRGQLWMAKDADGRSSYVVVLGLGDDPRTAAVIPLSNDEHDETADSLVVEKGAPLNVTVVVWPAFRTIIPICVLYKPLKSFMPATVDALESGDPKKADPADIVRIGAEAQNEDSPALDDRDDIALTLVLWHAQCAQLPPLGQLDAHGNDDGDALEAYSQALKDVLGLEPQIRLAVVRGNLALNAVQQREMERAGFPQPPKKSTAIPDDYLILAEQPEFHEMAERIDPHRPERARLAMAQKAAYGLAARTTGHGTAALRGAFLKAAEQLLDKGRDDSR